MANLNYVVGNWTVVSKEVDTISTAKPLTVVDIDYAHDYSVASQTAGRTDLLNTSGTSLDPVERFVYQNVSVDNIFHGMPVPDSAKNCPKKGRGVIIEHMFLLEATNSVSGETLVFPLRLRTQCETITLNVVTKAALDWALPRHIGGILETGSTDSTLIMDAFRGDTDPTK
jgi:hypothetical protein